MISERDVADGFHSFWNELFPFLTSDFVRIFNGTYATPLLDKWRMPISALPTTKEVRHHDIVAEVAFHLAREAFQANTDTNEAINNEELRKRSIERTRDVLLRVHEGQEEHFELDGDEWQEVGKLLTRYSIFLDIEREAKRKIEFEPRFPGLGFVGKCRGDLAAGRILYEIKTVVRSLHGRDLRQLFVYLALQAATDDRRWDFGGFFNPRRGLIYRFHVEDLIAEISGGKTGIEIFGEIADFFCSRDVELDRSF